MRNSPSTSSILQSTSRTSSTPVLFEIVENNPTFIDLNNILHKDTDLNNTLPKDQDKKLLEIENENQSDILTEINNSEFNIREPSPKRIKFEKEEFNLKDILLKTAYGRTLIEISKHGQSFTTRCQSILCNIIVTHLLNLDTRLIFYSLYLLCISCIQLDVTF